MSVLALVAMGAGLLVAVGGPSSAEVTAVTGSASGVRGSISLFGGPPMTKDPTPEVTLPPGGGSESESATPTLSMSFGPAVFFRSGAATVATEGTTGPTGSVTSSTTFGPTAGTGTTPCAFAYPATFTAGSTTVTSATANFTAADVGRTVSSEFLPETPTAEPERITTIATVVDPTTVALVVAPTGSGTGFLSINRGVGSCIYASSFTADTAGSTCTANEAGVTGSAGFTNGLLTLETDDYQNPTKVVAIPDDPAPNLSYDGFFILNGGTTESYTVTFNEQITNPDGSLTVNAAHLRAHGATAIGDTYFGTVACGAGAVAPTTTTSTVPPTTTTSTVPPTICDTVASTTSTTTVSGETPSAQANPSSVAAGGETSVTGDGFEPGESLDFDLCSTPVRLGTVTADAGGAYLATLTIPAGTALGAHTIVVSNADGSRVATAGLTVVAASGGGGGGTTTAGSGGALSRTGVDSARVAWQAGLALLMGLLLVHSARRAPSWGHTAMGTGVTDHLRRSLASGAHRFGRRRFPWEKRGRR